MFTKDRKFYRSFIVLAVTLMLEQTVVLSVNLADNIMLGRYSETALAGVAAVNMIQFMLQQIINGINGTMIMLGSQYWGQKRTGEIRKICSIAMHGAILIIVVLFSAVSFFPAQTLRIFTPDADIIAEGMEYLAIIRFSYLFFGVSTILLGSMRMVETVRIALTVSLVALGLNCSINYILIYGHFGAPEMGVRGAAIGTLIARGVECLILLWFVLVHDRKLHLRLADFLHIDKLLLKDFVRCAIPALLIQGSWGLCNMLQTVILGHLSSVAIAAQSISSNLFLMLKVASMGASSAAGIIIGKTIGENKGLQCLKEYTRTLQVIFIGFGVVLGTIMFSIRTPMLNLYNISPETRALANAYMIVQSIILVTMSYQMPTNGGIIRGGGDVRFVLIQDVISIWCIVMPLSFLAAFVWKLPPIVVIILLNSDQAFKCIPAAIRVNSYKWIKKLTRD